MELFLDNPDDPEGELTDSEGEGRALMVLMNWLGSNAEPDAWEADLGDAEDGDPADIPDFGEVLGHIRRVAANPDES